jgi:phospholipase/lecithinase/hemolysin
LYKSLLFQFHCEVEDLGHKTRSVGWKLIMKLNITLASLLSLLSANAAAAQELCSNDIVVFGDSFSDTGNLFAISGGGLPPAPYDSGRFTNGKVWVEFLADLMKLSPPAPRYSSTEPSAGTNYAIAGAASGNDPTITWIPALTGGTQTLPAKGLRLQIQDFLNDYDDTSTCSSELVVIWVGANDFGLLGQGPNYENIVKNIEDGIEDLISKGGATKILVLNLPALPSTPAAVGTYTSLFVNQTLPAGMAESVEAYNKMLEDVLKNIDANNEGVNIIHADIAPLFDEAASNPVKFGLDDTKDTGIPRLNETAFFLGSSVDYLNVENALWFDGVHPTTTFHEVLATKVHKIVKKSSKGSKKGKGSKGAKGSKGPKGAKGAKN